MSLFVPEDPEEPHVTVKQEEEVMEVDELIEEEDIEEEELIEDEDDPIIREIPIHLNPIDDESMKLMLLQYTTRRKQGDNEHKKSSIPDSFRYKPKSQVIELELPFEKDKFFNEDKSKNWNGLKGQLLRGVVNRKDSSGYFMGRIGKDGEVHLSPITGGTTQLRPSFRYIDEVRLKKIQREAEEAKQLARKMPGTLAGSELANEEARKKNATMHVVQMTAKSSNQAIPRLGGALLSKKGEDEEVAETYDVLARGNYDEEAIEGVLDDDGGEVLESKMRQGEYVDVLVGDASEEAVKVSEDGNEGGE
ncbi:DEKNAAC104394 [Brettanomyces naardenensis]|uniref:DEKNAAC104394 n=1 Tax=Brettanomyces naardenensis TaxID=13370 RepID=A0A448YQQ1_BRENA|nr:DEKNAAC104394 [Brettanomyces naardenensis]